MPSGIQISLSSWSTILCLCLLTSWQQSCISNIASTFQAKEEEVLARANLCLCLPGRTDTWPYLGEGEKEIGPVNVVYYRHHSK